MIRSFRTIGEVKPPVALSQDVLTVLNNGCKTEAIVERVELVKFRTGRGPVMHTWRYHVDLGGVSVVRDECDGTIY